MKTILLSASFAVISLVAPASGTKEKNVTTYHANENFYVEFGKVENVRWTNAMDGMMRADFTVEDQTLSAFFDADGKYLAYTRIIGANTLPLNLQEAVNKKLKNGVITTAFEMNSKDETTYFIETMAAGKKRVWKGNEAGQLSSYYVKD